MLTPTQNAGRAKPSFAAAILEEAAAAEPISQAKERKMSGAVGAVYTGRVRPSPPLSWLILGTPQPGLKLCVFLFSLH